MIDRVRSCYKTLLSSVKISSGVGFLPTLCKIEEKFDNLPAKTNKIPLTNVRFLLLELQLPTKQTVPPIRRISRLDKGNHVDRLIVTENRKNGIFKGTNIQPLYLSTDQNYF